MKKLAILSACVFAASLAGAQEPTKDPTAARPSQGADMNAKTRDIQAEVVSYNDTTKTLTIKNTTGMSGSTSPSTANQTVPVEPAAVSAVKNLKAGQKVTLTCRENESGQPGAITAVKMNSKSPARMDEKQ